MKTALIGLHDEQLLSVVSTVARIRGYDLRIVRSIAEVLTETNSNNYDRYLMDINLGSPGKMIIRAKEVYELIQNKYGNAKERFIGISGHSEIVRAGILAGVPCEFKPFNLLRFLS